MKTPTKYTHLKDYTLDELFEAIEDNERIEARLLAGYCSEILKRQREELMNFERNKWNGLDEQ